MSMIRKTNVAVDSEAIYDCERVSQHVASTRSPTRGDTWRDTCHHVA